MQISRCILWASVTATLLFPLALVAQDADADAKLQEALKQKIKELQPPPAATPPAPTPPVATQPASTPAAVPAPVKPVAPTVAPVAASDEEMSPQDAQKMRDALRRKINQLDAEQPPAPVVPPPAPPRKPEPVYPPLVASNPPPAKVVTQPAKPKPAEPKQVEPKTAETKPAASPKAVDRDAAIAAAVAQANAEQASTKAAGKSDMPMGKPQKEKPVASARTPLFLPPLSGPPSSLSGSQQARLQALDQQYMADLISSEQYHARRAKIIAEP